MEAPSRVPITATSDSMVHTLVDSRGHRTGTQMHLCAAIQADDDVRGLARPIGYLLSCRHQLRQAAGVTRDDTAVIAVIRHIVIQAAREGELRLEGQPDEELRGSIVKLLSDLAASEWNALRQSEHQPKLIRAAERFVEEDEAELAIVMYATAIEHWLNGMLEIGLRRRGERLDKASERAPLETKLTTKWQELLGFDFPDELREAVLELAGARNDFVHYKWPMHSEQEHDAHQAEVEAIARDAPRLYAALSSVEDSIVFGGERERLNRILDEMQLFDLLEDDPPGETSA